MEKFPYRLVQTEPKMFIGTKLEMSLVQNTTFQLWSGFRPLLNQIQHRVGTHLVSLQVYPADYFLRFEPNKTFTKWALAEVSLATDIPNGMELFTLEAGQYFVYDHKGADTQIFAKIFGEILPQEGFVVDHRPHFEVLGERYKVNSPDSEEEIWIPVKKLNS